VSDDASNLRTVLKQKEQEYFGIAMATPQMTPAQSHRNALLAIGNELGVEAAGKFVVKMSKW